MATGIYNFKLSRKGLKRFLDYFQCAQYKRDISSQNVEKGLSHNVHSSYEKEGLWHLTLCGRADSLDTPGFQDAVEVIVKKAVEVERVIIDCTLLESINSVGLTLLFYLASHSSAEVVLKNTRDSIRTLLDISGLDKMVTVSEECVKH